MFYTNSCRAAWLLASRQLLSRLWRENSLLVLLQARCSNSGLV